MIGNCLSNERIEFPFVIINFHGSNGLNDGQNIEWLAEPEFD